MVSSQPPALFTRFTTLTQPPERRLQYWNEVIGGVYKGMTIAGNRDIAASWAQCWLGRVRLADVCSQKAVVDRHNPTPASGSRSEKVHFVIPKRGSFLISQRGRSASVGAGDLTVLWADEPYQIAVSEGNESFVIDCPARSLPKAAVHYPVAQCVDGAASAVRLLCSFLRSLLHQDWPETPDQQDKEVLGDVLLKLVSRCLGPAIQDSCRTGTRERVLSFVAKHIADSELRTATIAQALSLSPRSVQNVFAGMATTPTAFILSRRLTAAAEILQRADDFGNITDLAFDLGFNDSSYFARRFKMRFGISPCQYRHAKRN